MTISFNNGSSGNCNNSGIKDFHINVNGDLIVTYADGTFENLGHVVGSPGINGKNFYPTETGYLIPDGAFKTDWELGDSYLSLSEPVTLYFKTSNKNTAPSTWSGVIFGKGAKGDPGRPFNIDAQGPTLPTPQVNGFPQDYTFYNTTDGKVYFWDVTVSDWYKSYQYRGPEGLQGRFQIDYQGPLFPEPISGLPVGYTFYDTDNGMLYYVQLDTVGNKTWGAGIRFEGPRGENGDKGDPGADGKDAQGTTQVYNVIDNSYNNALLVIGTCPAGYVVNGIEIDITEAFQAPVNEMKVRFGGTAQDDNSGIVIAPYDNFDIHRSVKYIVQGVNHAPSANDEILSCVFDDSVNNSDFGRMVVRLTLVKQGEPEDISSHI